MTFRDELILGVVIAGIALASAFLGSLTTGWQASRSRRDSHTSRVLVKRHELYQKCVEVFDANLDVLMGGSEGRTVTVEETSSIDLQMQLFADHNVLVAGDGFRDCIREVAQRWTSLTPGEKRELALRAHAARTRLLAAMRADLAIDSLSYGPRWARKLRYRRLMTDQLGVLAKLDEDLPADAYEDAPVDSSIVP